MRQERAPALPCTLPPFPIPPLSTTASPLASPTFSCPTTSFLVAFRIPGGQKERERESLTTRARRARVSTSSQSLFQGIRLLSTGNHVGLARLRSRHWRQVVRWRDEGRRFRIFTRVLAGLNYSKLVHDAYLSSYLLSRISSSNFFFFFFLYLIVDPLVPPLFITFSYFSTDRRVLMNSSSPPLDSSLSRIFFFSFYEEK